MYPHYSKILEDIIVPAQSETISKERKNDLINLLILISIASIIGIYLICTTVLIAKDGVFYIEQAQKLNTEPVKVIKEHSPGYPFLIFVTHKFASFFSDSSSIYAWIHSAQVATLLCRVLCLIPLYFIGKIFVGGRNSFWALLVLIFLPDLAEFGSDALRDWPHLLFLATGFLFLLLAAKDGKWWMFGIVGLCAGLGHMIRPECAQLIVYGVLWLSISFIFPKHNMNRPRLIYALLILLISFTVLTVPYMKITGKLSMVQLKTPLSFSQRCMPVAINGFDSNDNNLHLSQSFPRLIANGVAELANELAGGTMYFFLFIFLIGAYTHFRNTPSFTSPGQYFWALFVLFNIILLLLLYYNREYISTRHCLPLISFLCFYIPNGLQLTGNWVADRFFKLSQKIDKNSKTWFFVLLSIGIAICIPKLIRPIRIEKKGYRSVSIWLRDNTTEEDVIAVPDKRILFYAERDWVLYESVELPPEAKYIVRILGNEEESADIGGTMRKELSIWVDEREKKKRFVIYKIM